MSTIKQILRLKQEGEGIKWIARTLEISRNTIRKYLALADQLEPSYAELLALEDHVLEALFHPEEKPSKDERLGDLLARYAYIQRELKRPGVTRFLLWSEYRKEFPSGYCYSQFCWHLQKLDRQAGVRAVLRHEPADMLYIDFAGKTLTYVEKETGEVREAQVFIATLGYSQYSYVEAVPSQKTVDFIGALGRALVFFGGVPHALVPDNLKSAVIKSDRYEPALNQLLEDFANHCETAVIPARVRAPRDKALVEAMVNHAYRKIYAPLRNETFEGLEALNEAIQSQLAAYHAACFQGRDYSREELFRRERPLLKPLPAAVFEIIKRRRFTVQKNSHILLGEDKHYYSVPYKWIGTRVTAIYTPQVVSIYAGSKPIAVHERSRLAHQYTTVKEHLPSYLQHYMERSPLWYHQRAAHLGPEVETLFGAIFESKRHPEQAYKSCDGLLALARRTDRHLFLDACRIALDLQVHTYGFVKRILANGMAGGQAPAPAKQSLPEHANTRGKQYYFKRHE